VASLIFSGRGWYVAHIKNPYRFDQNTQTELVSDKIFADQVVDLDGKEYRYCKFYNVKFLYNGTSPIKLNHDEFNGSILLNTENPAVGMSWGLMQGMGFSNVPFFGLDMKPLPNLMPPTRNVIPQPQPPPATAGSH
jgi:hypothetical protein